MDFLVELIDPQSQNVFWMSLLTQSQRVIFESHSCLQCCLIANMSNLITEAVSVLSDPMNNLVTASSRLSFSMRVRRFEPLNTAHMFHLVRCLTFGTYLLTVGQKSKETFIRFLKSLRQVTWRSDESKFGITVSKLINISAM